MKHATIVTLGCSKNLVDSEHLAAHLQRNGWLVAFDANPRPGDVLLLNTCGFIGDAKEESIQQILAASRMRERGELSKLIVFGCLSQRYRDALPLEIPEVDAWYGVHDLADLLLYLGCDAKLSAMPGRLISTPGHYAYLKIAEGCNRHCAFCAIPSIRGRYRSEPLEGLLDEAHLLAQGGVRELILIAQELTYYGRDRRSPRLLLALLEGLASIPQLEWIRLHYAYPTDFPAWLIDWLACEAKACKYLDIPIQHISDPILQAMQRTHSAAHVEALVEKLRVRVPSIALRTTLIVGFPNETNRDFRLLADFVRQAKFEHLGVFTYSEEEGTHAARRFADNVPEDEKCARRDYLMKMQRDIAAQWRAHLVGETLPVIIDQRADALTLIGRTQYDSPEVDGEVLIRDSTGNLRPGIIAPVRITGSSEYDLEGQAFC